MGLLSEIKKNNSPLVNQNEGDPCLVNSPQVTQVLLSGIDDKTEVSEEFILAKKDSCHHSYIRSKDKAAIQLVNSMDRLHRRIEVVIIPKKYILIVLFRQ